MGTSSISLLWLKKFEIFAVAFVFELVDGNEAQGCRIDAVTQSPGIFGAVIKYMTQVARTVARAHLSPVHSMTVVRQFLDVFGLHGLCETWPATVAIKFVEGRKERFTGNDVHVDTWLIVIPIR